MKEVIEPMLFKIIKTQFKSHLLIERNLRTIFSGKFGSGKTTFLQHFFTEEKKFIPITLHPVNYSIASNEDIYRYIKYDLLLELIPLINLDDFQSIDLNLSEKAYLILTNQLPELIENVISFFGALGKHIDTSIEILEKVASIGLNLKKSIDAYAEQLSQENDEHRQIYQFLESIKKKPSSLYEDTLLTKLIDKAVQQLKKNKNEVILVIEDLDRIDPEHIFRILNVFSAHFDSKTLKGKNSFGIDVVVAVCDEDNIRNIFSNRYGSNVDYSGYIDKFYSRSIFHFDYADLALEYIRKTIGNLTINRPESGSANDTVHNVVKADGFLQYILPMMFDQKMINLRSINQVLKNPVVYSPTEINLGRHAVNLFNNLIVFELLILIEISGGITSSLSYTHQLSAINETYHHTGMVFERIAAVLALSNGLPNESKINVTIEETTVSGILDQDRNQQFIVRDLALSGPFGTLGVDAVKTNLLFSAIHKAILLIHRSPRLRLNSYYQGQF